MDDNTDIAPGSYGTWRHAGSSRADFGDPIEMDPLSDGPPATRQTKWTGLIEESDTDGQPALAAAAADGAVVAAGSTKRTKMRRVSPLALGDNRVSLLAVHPSAADAVPPSAADDLITPMPTPAMREAADKNIEERMEALRSKSAEVRARARRGIAVSLVVIFVYLASGVVFYSLWEGWPVNFALYFSVVVCTTVGYGDQSPIVTWEARLFTSFFAFFGVALILSVGAFLISQFYDYRRRRKLRRRRHLARKEARGKADRNSSKLRRGLSTVYEGKVACVRAIKNSRIGRVFRALSVSFINMILAWGVWIAYFMMARGEKLNFVESFYFTVVSATTVGFGDVTPQTAEARAFATVWLVVLVITTTAFLSEVAGQVVPPPEDTQIADMMREGGPKAVYEMSEAHATGSPLTYTAWLETLCVATGKVDKDFIHETRSHFEYCDFRGHGVLSRDDFDFIDNRFKVYQHRHSLDHPHRPHLPFDLQHYLPTKDTEEDSDSDSDYDHEKVHSFWV
mmetsp:Transcript_37484/g.98312  ORF Transcript_37484/g.98312 Transcript_37484/m.98312 type:complete len:510 (+) Transcript_37484:202-1731(+)